MLCRLASSCCRLAVILTAGSIAVHASTPTVHQAKESNSSHELSPSTHRLREGLSRAERRFADGPMARVAFIGGSITWGAGWRDQVEASLRERYPETSFAFTNAGIPSTGSVPGAFRLERDVFAKGPIDLLVVEFAVNDSTNGRTTEQMVRGLEGLVRRARRLDPEIDILLLHFADPQKLASWGRRKTPAVVAAHERVAAHYGLPSIDLSREVFERIDAGEFTWKDDFKNLHPSPFGHRLYASSIDRMFDAAWSRTTAIGANRVPTRKLPLPIDPASYSGGELASPHGAATGSGFRIEETWRPKDGAGTRDGFVGVPALVSSKGKRARTTFGFRGTAVGIFVAAGPDAGVIRSRVDGGPWKDTDLMTPWSGRLHLPWFHVLADALPDGDHLLELRVRPRPEKDRGGQAVRIFHFGVNRGESTSAARPREEESPNIVVILADDMGQGDPRCYNPDSKIPTPHLDRLAAAGMRFTDAHSPSAVCTPTRYGLLTGRYAWRTRMKRGVLGGRSSALIEPGQPTIASMLRGAGYHTAGLGKWHLGLGNGPTDYGRPLTPGPLDVGFDYYFGIPASLDMEPYLWILNRGVLAEPTLGIAGSGHRRKNGGGFWRGGGIAPGFRHDDVQPELVRRATEYIHMRASSSDSRPFFLYVPLAAPHTPWLPLRPSRGKSGAGHYGDFVHMVDRGIGQILAALDKTDQARDTLVIFTSDNGSHWPQSDVKKFGHRSNFQWRGQKADIHEGGHRVPFIVRWPGRVEAASSSDALIGLHDILATVAEVTGRKKPARSPDSVSFLAALKGGEGPRTSIVNHSANGKFALRRRRWKLIEGLGSGGFTAPRMVKHVEGAPKGQLYDLIADPGETNNLWMAQQELVMEMQAELDAVRK